VLEHALLLVFPAAMAFAGAMDLLTMTIPNRVSLALAAAFPVAAAFAGLPLEQALLHLSAGLLVLLIGILFFSQGWLGGGDAKLLAASALWIGLGDLVTYCAVVAILGGALALLILAYRRLPIAALPGPGWALKLHRADSGIPYGLAIAGGALWIYPQTLWFAAFGG
jgi:prepilin peptidase CpaA